MPSHFCEFLPLLNYKCTFTFRRSNTACWIINKSLMHLYRVKSLVSSSDVCIGYVCINIVYFMPSLYLIHRINYAWKKICDILSKLFYPMQFRKIDRQMNLLFKSHYVCIEKIYPSIYCH